MDQTPTVKIGELVIDQQIRHFFLVRHVFALVAVCYRYTMSVGQLRGTGRLRLRRRRPLRLGRVFIKSLVCLRRHSLVLTTRGLYAFSGYSVFHLTQKT